LQLGALAKDAEQRRIALTQPAPKSTNLGFSDIEKVGKQVIQVAEELSSLESLNKADDTINRELETGLLRGTLFVSLSDEFADIPIAKTRKEVIARLHRANKDAELSKMQKSKSLNPDHAENQIQLRRKIRVSSDVFFPPPTYLDALPRPSMTGYSS
jgi:nucleoporin NUP159